MSHTTTHLRSDSAATVGQQPLSALQAPPSITAHPLLKALPESTFLPAELLGILNHTYFLHLLVTDPAKVNIVHRECSSQFTNIHGR